MRLISTIHRLSPFLTTTRLFSTLPPSLTVSEVLAADFPRAVKIGELVVKDLHSQDPATVASVEPYLNAMLSSSDGIRGFMVSYLTSDTHTPPAQIHPLLKASLASSPDAADLISLSLMNFIMPTAMATTYALADKKPADCSLESDIMAGSDASMSATSARTAARGAIVLAEISSLYPEQTETQIAAIQRVCEEGIGPFEDDECAKTWAEFAVKWEYGTDQVSRPDSERGASSAFRVKSSVKLARGEKRPARSSSGVRFER